MSRSMPACYATMPAFARRVSVVVLLAYGLLNMSCRLYASLRVWLLLACGPLRGERRLYVNKDVRMRDADMTKGLSPDGDSPC